MSNTIKDAGRKAIETVILIAIAEVSKVLNDFVKEYIVEVYKNLKERNQKYNHLRSLYTSSDTKFEDLQRAIEEADRIVVLFESDLDLLNNKKNPIDIVKYQFLVKEYTKWKTMLHTLKSAIALKITYEVHSMYYSKQASNFFESFPGIIEDVSSIETKGQLNNLLLEIKSLYLDVPEQG